ncbi:acyl-homoserine-lactone synthase [Vibrio sp. ZSDE26]|uniref:acyl-homoserine-lactone synthase n=1 Tax=Vibrio amylolyticus TaxID=2847292 RepID=A0A9X2BFJ0_9VIBR|nr:acyl-homoserine-lactone synthase [Vibrio amylolyticus]
MEAEINHLQNINTDHFCSSSQEKCFYLAHAIEAKFSSSFCSDILNKRLSITYLLDPTTRSLSIASCIESSAYLKALNADIPAWPEEYKQIETLAIRSFGNWARFWCEYEIYNIRQRYPYRLDLRPIHLPIDESSYHSCLINDVQDSISLYQTLYHQSPMLLTDALALINLSTLVLINKWYEILLTLNISRQGCHFLLTYPNNQSRGQPSTIVSSLRVQSWQDAQNWLHFDPFFQNKHWKMCLPSNLRERCLDTGLFDKQFSYEGNCNQSFEHSFSSHILDKSQVCEVIRLTVSGTASQGAFFLFLAQKRIMPHLEMKNFKLAYTITEQPWIVHFYETLKYGGYFHSSFRLLENSRHNTYKGFWVIPSLRYELEKIGYQTYKRRVVSKMKESKENRYV